MEAPATIDWFAVTTIVAVLVGPIFAVIVTRLMDNYRAARERKFHIFRSLMKTRKMPIHLEHVEALNLVEIEFIKHAQVITTWKAYLENLGSELPPTADKAAFDSAIQKRDSLLTKLLSDIANVLKVKIAQLDILHGNYVPQGWVNDDIDQRLVRTQLLNVLSGRAPLSIRPAPAVSSPFPPPPENQ